MPNEDVVTLAGTGPEPGRSVAVRSVPAPALPDGGPLLRTVDLTRDFGGVHAVAGVSIEVRRGTLTGLIGPNGAGKSTLLAMLAGTLPVTCGQVIYAGTDVTTLPAFRRARLGLVRTFQLASEFKRLTVMENLLSAVPRHRGDTLAGALRGRRYWRGDEEAAIDRARALLDRFGLSEYADTYAGDLSGGQRLQQGGLAGPVRPDDGGDRPGGDLDRDAVDDVAGAVSGPDVLGAQYGRPSRQGTPPPPRCGPAGRPSSRWPGPILRPSRSPGRRTRP